MDDSTKGKLIVLYGVNNLGKTTQAKMLVESLLIQFSKNAEYIKFPIYNIEPSGSLITSYLKQGNPFQLTDQEFQFLQVLNRTQYQDTLKEKLNKGTWIIAEDYIGTGIAWGIARGLNKDLLTKLNSHLIQEDLGILFSGQPFTDNIDQSNIHETNTKLTKQAINAFNTIADEYSWHKINSENIKDQVQQDIINIIKSKLQIIT